MAAEGVSFDLGRWISNQALRLDHKGGRVGRPELGVSRGGAMAKFAGARQTGDSER